MSRVDGEGRTMKKNLTYEDLKTLRDAHLDLAGTPEYMKYKMENEWKYRKDNGNWSAWKWVGWYIPYSYDKAQIKKVRDTVYIVCEHPDGLGGSNPAVERYKVTPEVNELLHIYEEGVTA